MPARSRGTLQAARGAAPGCSAGGESLARSLRARPETSSSPGRSRPPGRRKADGGGGGGESEVSGDDARGVGGGSATTLRSWSSSRWGCLCAWTTRRAATDLRVPSVAKLFFFSFS